MCNKRFFGFFFVLAMVLGSCTLSPGRDWIDSPPPSPDMGGGDRSFKVPIPPGYNWEITQSWFSHCSECQQKYSDWNYCELSHSWNCCKYGWDFNLPGNEDKGKPVLATSDGIVLEMGLDYGWGNYVVIDHGSNICSRYAHMLNNSTDHLSEGQTVCQGLKIGEIGTTGDSSGHHLHFQFEECDSSVGIAQRFTDGNGVPKCTRGNDIFDSQDNYTALILTNRMVYSCDQSGETFGGGELSEGGWYSAECGNLPGCPLIPNCGREWGHDFTDQGSLSSQVAEAGAYLHSECALDGKADGGLHPSDKLTRAEALKVPMFLYGLMDSCGASDPFADVDQSDWYFGVIACAVLHGIVNSVADYFRPNDEVEFAEAAKFVVEAASRAGVIDIKNPSQGHFSNIPRNHWAYKYVETIYHYGGLDSSALNFSTDREIDRGDYFIMVASLSSCYCRNVNCENGCRCDQSVYACVDPNDMTPGAGGDGGDNPDDPEDPEEFYPDVSIHCYVDTDDTQCVIPDTVLRIECDVTNNGSERVNVNDLGLTMIDSSAAAICQVTDDDYRNGVGYSAVDPGDTENVSGHFEITCLERPADGGVDVSLDLTHRDSGVNTVFPDVEQTTISIPTTPFAQCEAEFYIPDCVADCTGVVCGHDGCGGICNSCPYGQSCNLVTSQCQGDYQVPWGNCDPAVGYTVIMDSPGGTYEVAASGPTPYLSGSFVTGSLYVHFDCIDLPGSILIHGGPQYVHAYLQDSGQPDFYFWSGYSGPLMIDPSMGAGGHTSSFTATFPNLSLLLRTPNP